MSGCLPRLPFRLAALGLLALGTPARAQSPENILLVVNQSSAASQQVSDYYARKRAIPQDNILRINVEAVDQVSRADFERHIEAPIAGWLGRHSAQDRILYIVLTKGIPLRVGGTAGRNGTVASVDSELTLLYRKLTGRAVPPSGRVPNPYFLADTPLAQAKPFTHEAHDIFLVNRLDGFTVEDVFSMIDRGSAPAREGKIVLDQKGSWVEPGGNDWLNAAAEALRQRGFGARVMLDATSAVVTGENQVLGYYSWGSNDPAIKTRRFGLGFAPGAVAAMFVSTDARTFREPPPTWNIGGWENPTGHFAGSPQSLSGDLIREGVTGVAGHVAEPYLDGSIRPQILFHAYLAGFSLIESFYLAMPYLSWQTIVVGDPLCAPFRSQQLTADQIDKGIDSATQLPRLFAARRVQVLSGKGTNPEAVALMLRATVQLMQQDRAGAQQALEEATALDDRLTAAHLTLGSIYEQAGEHDKAIARYRRVLANTPTDPVALNNLAYALALRKNAVAEALPLARKAYTLSKDPAIVDTLGWVLHLKGDAAEAATLLAEAARGAPLNAEIRLHAAFGHAAVGDLATAARELTAAIDLDANLKTREDVRQLQAKLPGRP